MTNKQVCLLTTAGKYVVHCKKLLRYLLKKETQITHNINTKQLSLSSGISVSERRVQ